MYPTITYTVDEIHCAGCEHTIRTLMGDVPGVERVEPDHKTNQVVVTYDESRVDDADIRQALANTGFGPR